MTAKNALGKYAYGVHPCTRIMKLGLLKYIGKKLFASECEIVGLWNQRKLRESYIGMFSLRKEA